LVFFWRIRFFFLFSKFLRWAILRSSLLICLACSVPRNQLFFFCCCASVPSLWDSFCEFPGFEEYRLLVRSLIPGFVFPGIHTFQFGLWYLALILTFLRWFSLLSWRFFGPAFSHASLSLVSALCPFWTLPRRSKFCFFYTLPASCGGVHQHRSSFQRLLPQGRWKFVFFFSVLSSSSPSLSFRFIPRRWPGCLSFFSAFWPYLLMPAWRLDFQTLAFLRPCGQLSVWPSFPPSPVF